MNKNATPIILLILAIGIYFTFTKAKIENLKSIQNVNAGYTEALNNAEKLIKVRDNVLKTYNEISELDRNRLEKMVPNNIDNVRLTLDVKSIGLGRGLILKNVKTNAPNINTGIVNSKSGATEKVPQSMASINPNDPYNTVILSFSVSTDYLTFLELLKDLEKSLRIMDVSKITLTVSDTGSYDYGVELKTYWLKQ